MSKADKLFVKMCSDIIEHGLSSEGQEVRPRWDDGTPAHTIKKFGVINRYNLQEEFPAITLRPTAIKSATDEVLWIWQRKSNNINHLASHVWDEWADETGSIGKAYGYQMGLMYKVTGVSLDRIIEMFGKDSIFYDQGLTDLSYYTLHDKGNNGKIHAAYNETTGSIFMDQIDYALYQLRYTPFSRRIIVSSWNPSDATEMGLLPCAYSMTFNVTQNDEGKFVLNAILNQRSQDILAANNWNVVQYSLLLMMFAQVSDMVPGELVHVIADAHIYDRHVPIIKQMLDRPQFPAPTVRLNPDIKNFYDFTVQDIIVENYQKNEQIKNIPVAI